MLDGCALFLLFFFHIELCADLIGPTLKSSFTNLYQFPLKYVPQSTGIVVFPMEIAFLF